METANRLICGWDGLYFYRQLAPRMPSSISLPSEVWFDIVQDLKLRDLLALCESFRGTAHAHVEVVSRQRAEELLYSIFTTSQVKAQFYIGGNRKHLTPYSNHSKRRLHAYSHPPAEAHRSFVSLSNSKVKMDLSLWKFYNLSYTQPYDPFISGELPERICSVELSFHEKKLKYPRVLHLFFNKIWQERSRIEEQIPDEEDGGIWTTRTISQKLELARAFCDRRQKYKLPITYLTSILGSYINATIKFSGRETDKWFSDDRDFYVCRNPIRLSPNAASISFYDFSLPKSKTLRRLFPGHVIPPESEDQDEDGLSVLLESRPSSL